MEIRVNLPGFVDLSAILGSGIYALSDRGEVVYIGKSKALIKRIYAHVYAYSSKGSGRFLRTVRGIKAMRFDCVMVYPCAVSDLDRMERAMIAKYKPRYNEKFIPAPAAVLPLEGTIKGMRIRFGVEEGKAEAVPRRV